MPPRRTAKSVQAARVKKECGTDSSSKASRKGTVAVNSKCEAGACKEIIGLVSERLNGTRTILHGIDSVRSSLISSLTCAIQDNRGSSTFIVGPHGSGKTCLIQQTLSEVVLGHESTAVKVIHMKGIIFEEPVPTLRYLLNIFKKMLGIESRSDLEDADLSEFLAFDQLNAMVKQYLEATEQKGNAKGHAGKFIVFVLEDLDIFASHPQQNLLYCLFEMALALPVFILGSTCRIDVLELLEKRVKSRFSQNILYLPMPATFSDFLSRIDINLTADLSDAGYLSSIKSLLKTDENFKAIAQASFNLAKDVRPVFNILSATFALVDTSAAFDWSSLPALLLNAVHLLNAQGNPIVEQLNQTSLVELLLLASMCRLISKSPTLNGFTFDNLAEELRLTKQRVPSLENFACSKATVLSAFERLTAQRLFLPTSLTSSALQTDLYYRTVRLGLPHFLVSEVICSHPSANKELQALIVERF